MDAIIAIALAVEGWSLTEFLIQFAKAHPILGSILAFILLGIIANIILGISNVVGKVVPASNPKSVATAKAAAWYMAVVLAAFLLARSAGNELKYVYFAAFLLGLATAMAEIIGKFTDSPLAALKTQQAFWYLAFNGALGAFAVYVLKLMNWSTTGDLDRLKLTLAAGLGAMVVMRAKLFSSKIGDQEVSVGPEQILKVYLDFLERDIDRIRAQSRVDFVRRTMEPLKFDEIKGYTLAMLDSAQALAVDRRTTLRTEITHIGTEDGTTKDEDKACCLGFLLSKEMGEDFLGKLFENPRPEWYSRAIITEKPPLADTLPKLTKLPLVERLLGGDDSVYYFAFGASMSSAVMRERLKWKEPSDKFLQLTTPKRGTLNGYRRIFQLMKLDNNASEIRANIVRDDNESVEGVVYRLSKETFEYLDCNKSNSTRGSVKVSVTEKGKPAEIDAYAYVAASAGDIASPPPEYVRQMLAGAREHNLSAESIAKLEELAGSKTSSATAA